MSVEYVGNSDAEGINEPIKKAFERIEMCCCVIGLNVDKGSVNTGIHSSERTKMKNDSAWLQTMHFFNHRLELGVKDCFKNTAFKTFDTMLTKLYILCQKSPKGLTEVRANGEALYPTTQKGLCTMWINHKCIAMKIALENCSAFLMHVESLAETNSKSKKRTKLKEWVNKW